MRRWPWSLAAFAALSLAPIAASFAYAALYSVGLAGLLAHGFTLEHWTAVLASAELWRSLAFSAALAAAVVAIATALGLALALGLGRALERGPLAWCIHVPMAFPGTAAALSVFALFGATGWVPRLLAALGWPGALGGGAALVHDRLGAGVALAHLFLATPFLALQLRALYRSERLEELAQLAAALGADRWRQLRSVLLPILLRRLRPAQLLVFIAVLGSYEIPLLLGRQSPQLLSVLVMRNFARFDLGAKPAALAISLLYSALVAALLLLALRRRSALERS